MIGGTTNDIYVNYYPSGIMDANTSVIIDKKANQAIVVEASGDIEPALKMLKENGNPTVIALLITHAHADHIHFAEEFRNDLPGKPKVYLGEKEIGLWRNIHAQFEDFGFGSYAPTLSDPDILIKDGDILFKDTPLETTCLEVEGHSPGGICYYFKHINLLCSGDILFKGSIGRSDWTGVPSLEGTGNGKKMVQQIKQKIFVLDSKTEVIPGHGDDTTIGRETIYNYAIRFDDF
ncbi:hypothetical protein WA158_008065 [Blastocystis sp. Blastoise]